MTSPKGTLSQLTRLSMLVGADVGYANTPGWMDRKFGFTAKRRSGRSTKTRKKRK